MLICCDRWRCGALQVWWEILRDLESCWVRKCNIQILQWVCWGNPLRSLLRRNWLWYWMCDCLIIISSSVQARAFHNSRRDGSGVRMALFKFGARWLIIRWQDKFREITTKEELVSRRFVNDWDDLIGWLIVCAGGFNGIHTLAMSLVLLLSFSYYLAHWNLMNSRWWFMVSHVNIQFGVAIPGFWKS